MLGIFISISLQAACNTHMNTADTFFAELWAPTKTNLSHYDEHFWDICNLPDAHVALVAYAAKDTFARSLPLTHTHWCLMCVTITNDSGKVTCESFRGWVGRIERAYSMNFSWLNFELWFYYLLVLVIMH